MSEFKGTKGKWGIMNAYQMAIPFIVYSNGETIFECYSTNGNDDAKANAKLISKAPEMFEMLKTLLDNSDVPNEIYDQTKQLIKEATTI